MRALCLLIILLLVVPIQSEGIRAGLEKAYARAERCARYKFLDGVLGNRAPGFQLFGPDGLNRDLTLERERFQFLFSRATRVRFKTQIMRVSSTPEGAQADVSQSLVVEQIDPQSRSLFTIVLSTRAIDAWKRTPNGWKLTSSSVKNQTSTRAGKLVEKSTGNN